MFEMSEYEIERRRKRDELAAMGQAPYGRRTPDLTDLKTAKAAFKEEHGQDGGPVFTVAGRVMLKRNMGKLAFLTLRDASGDLQIAVDKKRVDETAWKILDLTDLGDQLTATGPIGTTKKGETTLWVTEIAMASKALLPPPDKHHGLEDVELRYRQRYIDLWANPEVMQLARKRIAIIDSIRDFLRGKGFLEVETPMLQTMHGGAAARPFKTHHNALDLPLFMRIAPELYLKRLLVGGMGKVFEINRNFRNEGVSPRHNPEFTMLEMYEAYGNWETMADLVEEMVCSVAMEVFGTLQIEHRHEGTEARTHEGEATERRSDEATEGEDGGVGVPSASAATSTPRRVINLQRPWRRVSMADLVEERTGWKFDKRPMQEAAPELYRQLHGRVEPGAGGEGEAPAEPSDVESFRSQQGPAATNDAAEGARQEPRPPGTGIDTRATFAGDLSPAEQLVEVYEKLIEPTLIDPTFVTRVPSVIIPLARPCEDDPYFADVYELACNGVELSPGYTELNDPDIQREHFMHQVGDEAERQQIDEDFLTALKVGMPPAGGMGLGIDRLVMMLTGAQSIRDVILFPLMRPEKGGNKE